MESTLTNRQKQALKTKNKIFDTAIELFDNKGFSSVNIEEICKEASVSIGSFYYYFKSKHDIFFELYKRADDYFRDTVKNQLKEENGIDRILEFFDYYAIYNEMTGIHTVKQMMNSENKYFITKGRYMQELLMEIINCGQLEGEITSDMNSEEICEYLFILVRGIIFDWCLHDGNYDIQEKVFTYLTPVVKFLQS